MGKHTKRYGRKVTGLRSRITIRLPDRTNNDLFGSGSFFMKNCLE